MGKHCHHHHQLEAAHSHSTPPTSSFNFAFATAILLNLGFTLIEVAYAFYAHSTGLLADAVHNFGDIFGLLLAWGANWLQTLPAKKRYSYGYKKTSILAALANALMLVATSTLIVYQAIYKLFHVSPVDENIIIVVALIGIFVNGGTALLFVKGSQHDLNIKGAFLHLLYDALISIGVVIGGVAILLTGKMWLDPLIGLLIVLTILWGTWSLLRDSVRLILDAVPHYIDYQGAATYLANIPGVTAVHDLHIWGLSTQEVALTAHLVLEELQDVDYKKIDHELREKFHIHHATLQIETATGHLCNRQHTC